MLVICYRKNKLCGGYGDRVVGLVSIRMLCLALNIPFYILWDKEDVHKYIDYDEYDFARLEIKDKDVVYYDYVDNQQGLKELLQGDMERMFDKDKINYFYLNQEVSQYLYKNKGVLRDYYEDIMGEYKGLYSRILKPRMYIMERVNGILGKDKSGIIVGVQVRCGDYYMKTNKGESHRTIVCFYVDEILNNIKRHCDGIFGDVYSIFLTTDNAEVYDRSLCNWEESRIIYNDDMIQHLDREALNDDISKVFVDNYILSQRTCMMFITVQSNYGRVACLSSVHDNVYGLDGKKLDKRMLLSKHENW